MFVAFNSMVGTYKKSDGTDVRYIWVDNPLELNAGDLLRSANVDFMAFMNLYRSWMVFTSTYPWIATHCVEKYLKAILKAFIEPWISEKSMRDEYGHNIVALFNKYKEYYHIDDSYYDAFIIELNNVWIDMRYGKLSCIVIEYSFVATFVYFTTLMRYYFFDDKWYLDSVYWLDKTDFFTEVPYLKTHSQETIFKSLHLIMEHNVSIVLGWMTNLIENPPPTDFLKQSESDFSTICPFCMGEVSIEANFNRLQSRNVPLVSRFFNTPLK